MADHAKPTITSAYADFVAEVDGRFDDLAKGLDPAKTTATNVPTDTIRYTSAAKKWQRWNGTGWVDLANEYAINVSGYAAKLKTERTIALSGAATGTATAFDGTKNISINVTKLDASKLEGTAGIDTTGAAAKLATARTIALTGGATGSATFDGSADVSVPVSSLDATKLEGTASININGSAAKLKTARTWSFTGAAKADNVTFDGSGNVTVTFTEIDGTKATGLGTAASKTATESDNDATDGRLVAVGNFGLHSAGATGLTGVDFGSGGINLQVWTASTSSPGSPSGKYGVGYSLHNGAEFGVGRWTFHLVHNVDGTINQRRRINNGGWETDTLFTDKSGVPWASVSGASAGVSATLAGLAPGSVGTYITAWVGVSGTINLGTTISGANIRPAGFAGQHRTDPGVAGSWKSCSQIGSINSSTPDAQRVGEFFRYA
ncbi:hypothetical protein ERD78_18925 [Allopusillimonas soli]|uniref:Tail fiber protein n=1 Tax=Allopusillimonas soli TaxID=659016 RepID=A0A853FG50_9BURK|nr:hypothetical protein [Allopusillimonas soli]NYT38857.1 hypothetical protein [Allopusillimonas soli]TEA70143.1 hypothetical protein ERD78_18925 [Allopusillimonas soli]